MHSSPQMQQNLSLSPQLYPTVQNSVAARMAYPTGSPQSHYPYSGKPQHWSVQNVILFFLNFIMVCRLFEKFTFIKIFQFFLGQVQLHNWEGREFLIYFLNLNIFDFYKVLSGYLDKLP